MQQFASQSSHIQIFRMHYVDRVIVIDDIRAMDAVSITNTTAAGDKMTERLRRMSDMFYLRRRSCLHQPRQNVVKKKDDGQCDEKQHHP